MTRERLRGLLTGLAVMAGLIGLDIALENASISSSYMLGAIVAGVLSGRRAAVIVAIAATVTALVSGIWNEDFWTTSYYTRLFVAVLGNFFAIEAGRLQDVSQQQLRRQQLLAAVAELPAPGAGRGATAERLLELLVPRHAGYAAVDAAADGEQTRLGSRGTEPIDPSASLATPLRARGLRIGTLILGGGRFDDDPEFWNVLGGRAALALDNAGLSEELVSAEQQLEAILQNLGEAVTVQDRTGQLVFANQAAAGLLGSRSVEELLATPPEDLVNRFVSFNEDGSPVRVDQLPGRQVLSGQAPEPLVVRAINIATGEERWRLTKSTAVLDSDGNVRLAVNVIEDITDTKRAELTQRLLADASAVLASSLDYHATMQRVADLAVPTLADWCTVTVENDPLEQIAIAHGDPEMVELGREYARRYPPQPGDEFGPGLALRTGDAQLIAQVEDELLESMAPDAVQLALLRRFELQSLLHVPMATPERVLGVLSLATAESGRRFSDADVALAQELARRAATAIENARLYSELESVAVTLQRSLLPPQLPDIPGWSFSALYMPAGGESEVGGDFYDVFPTAAGWMAVMGDVVGRGAAAASLTAMGRYTLRTAGSLVGTPTMGLARLNENLRERGDMALCTAAIVLLREQSHEASLVSAGHPLPLLVRDGRVEPVGRTGPLLGAFDHGHWLPETVRLEQGDVLVLYTDGVTDARGPEDRFGDERLHDTLRGSDTAREAVDRIRAALEDFAGPNHDDDTAVLALQRL